jgi:hypothetical protein
VTGTNDDRVVSFHAASLSIGWIARVSRSEPVVQKNE